MSFLGYIATIGGVISVGLAIVIAVMRLRMKGLNSELDLSMALRRQSEESLKSLNDNYFDYRERTKSIQADLVAEIERFRQEGLEGIEAEPDDTRIELRRSWIADIMSKTSLLDTEKGK